MILHGHVVLLVAIAVSGTPDKAPELTTDRVGAAKIIAMMADVYKGCGSYSDSGVVKTVFFSKHGRRVDETPFTTAFVRPDRFRFEYSSKFPWPGAEPQRYIVWADGKDVRSWWDLQPGVKKEDSLRLAVATATGVSSGSAHTIPNLLMPRGIGGWSVVELRHPERIADAMVDDVSCYRVQGRRKDSDSEPITLWISKRTLLIHQIYELDRFPEFRTETTTTYHPRVGLVLDKSKLLFNPPQKRGE
jgi:hypothetical protein